MHEKNISKRDYTTNSEHKLKSLELCVWPCKASTQPDAASTYDQI